MSLVGTTRLERRPHRAGPIHRATAPSHRDLTPTSDEDASTGSQSAPSHDTVDRLIDDTAPVSIQLGALEVRPAARAIFVEGAYTELGGRAFDLLMALVNAKGDVVPKKDLLSQVWPMVTVVESNLKVQLSILRRALGPERWRIKTVSGRGYMLVAHDAQAGPERLAAPPSNPERPLVIVVEGDSQTRELVMRALSGVAKCLDGAARLALFAEDSEERALAL